MAKLPSEADLGGISNPTSGRPIASYDVTGYARGAAAIAGGVGDIGKGITGAARDVTTANAIADKETDALEEARANSNYLIKTKQLRDEISTATDPSNLEEQYKPKFQQAYDESAGFISNPKKRELWTLKSAPDLEGQNLAVGDKAYELRKVGTIADVKEKLDQIRNSALSTSDPAERTKFVDAGHGLIAGLKDAGYIDAVTAQKTRKDWTTNYAIGALEKMAPEDRVKELSSVIEGKDAVLDRIGKVENATGNPAARASTSSAMGNFQFTNGTWLATLEAHRPDLLQGRSAKDVLDLRADPKLSREMAGYLLDDNAAVLRNRGIAPTPTNLYLAHFLGPDDAAKVLKAPPGTPTAGLVQQASIDANQSVLQGKTNDTIIDWASRKMSGSAKGKGGLVDFIPEDKRYDMLNTARQEVAGANIDGERRSKLEQQQIKDRSDMAENDVIKDLWSDQPKMTVQSIARDDRLTVSAKERMIAAAGRVLGESKSDKTYGPAFMNVYQRVHLPDGSPEKITDPSMLYQLVGQKDGLTVQGVDKLVSEINSRKTPEGVAESEMRKQFLLTAKGKISGSDEGLHIKDPRGDELYLKFLAQAWPAYEEGKKVGKTPAQLLNPDSPDYVGKGIPQFVRPMNEWFSDVVNNGAKVAPAVQEFDIRRVKSLDDLMAAYRAGKVSRAIASELAIAKGWAAAAPAPAVVPVSR